MKLDKIITSALGASSVANGLPILDNKEHGNELGELNKLGNKAEIELAYDEMHPHKIRHPKPRNEMNRHQHQMNLHEIQDDDRRNPYYAQRPKRADILTPTGEEREREYIRVNESLSGIEKDYEKLTEDFEPSYRIVTDKFYTSLQEMGSIAKNLKADIHADEIPERSKTKLNKLADLSDQARKIYEDGKGNPLYTHPNAQTREKYNNIAPLLKAVEEVVESYRRVSAQEHSHQTHLDEMQGDEAREPEYFYSLNFKKRYNDLGYKLGKVNNSLVDLNNSRVPCLLKLCSWPRPKPVELISQKQEEKNNILSEIQTERDSIKWHLENGRICHSEEVEKANKYIGKYDDLIKNADRIRVREKREILSQQSLSEKLSNIATKVEENQSHQPLPSNVKQNTAIVR